MCGIFAYAGKRPAAEILLKGLEALEYRGYDSAGLHTEGLGTIKAAGPVENLKSRLGVSGKNSGTTGIAHTRWATHGAPTEQNAHPHIDCSGSIAVVHNGIIENYRELKEALRHIGHRFNSETDSEIISHLIEEELRGTKNLLEATARAINKITGTCGVAVMSVKEPGCIVTARVGSPIIIGIGEDEHFITSDQAALTGTNLRIVRLEESEIAVVRKNSFELFSKSLSPISRVPVLASALGTATTKDGYRHFMEKEIMETPAVLTRSIAQHIDQNTASIRIRELDHVRTRLNSIKNIIITGCGTAYYSGVIGAYLLEEQLGIPVRAELASELRYKQPAIDEETLVIAVSQSGETADTIAALTEAKRRGAVTAGIVNRTGSSIHEIADATIPLDAGPEIGVASTKAFVAQLAIFALIGLDLAAPSVETPKITRELLRLPGKISEIVAKRQELTTIAEKYAPYKNFLYIGRRYSYPIACEGALKLKEISYVHAEGCAAGEMKHGPLAMIDESFPAIAIVPSDTVYEKMLSNIEEIRARGGLVIAIANEGDEKIARLASDTIYIPRSLESLLPILSVIPLQLFAYESALIRGKNPDKPRNLAKSVTVE